MHWTKNGCKGYRTGKGWTSQRWVLMNVVTFETCRRSSQRESQDNTSHRHNKSLEKKRWEGKTIIMLDLFKILRSSIGYNHTKHSSRHKNEKTRDATRNERWQLPRSTLLPNHIFVLTAHSLGNRRWDYCSPGMGRDTRLTRNQRLVCYCRKDRCCNIHKPWELSRVNHWTKNSWLSRS